MSQNGNVPSSVLAQLRQRRAQLQQDRHLDLEVPGYSGLLHLRVRPVPWERLRDITQRAEKTHKNNPRKELVIAADTIIAATEQILYRNDKGELVPLNDDIPVRFDLTLAETLGIENVEKAREVLFGVFPDEVAVTAMYVEILEWQGSGDADVDEELVGKPEGMPASS